MDITAAFKSLLGEIFPGTHRHKGQWAELGLDEGNNFLIIRVIKACLGEDMGPPGMVWVRP